MARNILSRILFSFLGIIVAAGVILFIISGFFIIFFIGSLVLLVAILVIGPMVIIGRIRRKGPKKGKMTVLPPER